MNQHADMCAAVLVHNVPKRERWRRRRRRRRGGGEEKKEKRSRSRGGIGGGRGRGAVLGEPVCGRWHERGECKRNREKGSAVALTLNQQEKKGSNQFRRVNSW